MGARRVRLPAAGGKGRDQYAATSNPRPGRGTGRNPRYLPADVKRAVWERDQGRCTFVSESGHRCEAIKRIEFDHVLEVARGGEATVEGIRLRCRGHNQHQAERTFGTEFMRRKREEAAEARSAARAHRAEVRAQVRAEVRAQAAAAHEHAAAAREQPIAERDERDVVLWLRQLGFRPDEARRGAEACSSVPDASLEERVRLALRVLQPPHRRVQMGAIGAT